MPKAIGEEDLSQIFLGMSSKKEKPLSAASIKSYISKLNRISMMMTKKPFENYNFLLEPEDVINEIDKSPLKSKKDYYAAISKYLKFKNVDTKILNAYSKAMNTSKESEKLIRNDNLAKPEDIKKTNNMSLKDIQSKIKNYSIMDDKGIIDDNKLINKLITSFYFMNFENGLPILVPRNDLIDIKLVSSMKAKKPLSPEYNYLVMDGYMPTKIIMNKYKTNATYGKQSFKISPELTNILKEYIKEYKKQNGDYLFLMRDNKPFKSNNFSNIIELAMKDVLNTPIGIDLIRQIVLSNVYNSNPLMSINEKEQVARALLHSPNVSQEYLRKDLIKKE